MGSRDFDPHLRGLLDRLQGIWDAKGGAWLDDLAPGIPAGRIDELTEPLGLVLPAEGKTWYGWHNGPLRRPRWYGPRIGAYGGCFLSIERAVYLYHRQLGWALREVEGTDWRPAELGWDPLWFPIADLENGTYVAMDCSGPPDQPTPLYAPSKGDLQADLVVASSLASVVEMWLRLYEEGAYYFNDDEARWEWNDMPEWSRRAGADGLV